MIRPKLSTTGPMMTFTRQAIDAMSMQELQLLVHPLFNANPYIDEEFHLAYNISKNSVLRMVEFCKTLDDISRESYLDIIHNDGLQLYKAISYELAVGVCRDCAEISPQFLHIPIYKMMAREILAAHHSCSCWD